MKKLIIDKLPRIIKNKKKLEKALSVKITNRGKEIFFKGAPEKEFVAEKVILALDFGFPYSDALELADGLAIFEKINIKEHANSKNLPRVRARLIGREGKTLRALSELTKCAIQIKDNTIGIIGDPEFIENASSAVISLTKGTKQGNVYAYLEKHQPKEEIDLGLKKPKSSRTK